jgi:hypothetical protein
MLAWMSYVIVVSCFSVWLLSPWSARRRFGKSRRAGYGAPA